jgi:hypothetical protein
MSAGPIERNLRPENVPDDIGLSLEESLSLSSAFALGRYKTKDESAKARISCAAFFMARPFWLLYGASSAQTGPVGPSTIISDAFGTT